MSPEEIVRRIQSALPDAVVEPEGADCSFTVRVVSEAFKGQTPIQRQRPILALFKEEISSGELHALSIVARTPEEG